MDKYQKRYKAHQERKAEVLKQIISERHSERRFGSDYIDIQPILDAFDEAPSSCDRKGCSYIIVNERDDKNFLAGVLVGGVGWAHRSQSIILLFADPMAYKAEGEIQYMPFLDAGVMVGQGLLAASANNIAACYINPNIRQSHRPFFEKIYGENVYCGAIAVGSKHE